MSTQCIAPLVVLTPSEADRYVAAFKGTAARPRPSHRAQCRDCGVLLGHVAGDRWLHQANYRFGSDNVWSFARANHRRGGLQPADSAARPGPLFPAYPLPVDIRCRRCRLVQQIGPATE